MPCGFAGCARSTLHRRKHSVSVSSQCPCMTKSALCCTRLQFWWLKLLQFSFCIGLWLALVLDSRLSCLLTRTILGLLLFSYSAQSDVVFNYLNCVSVGDRGRVVWSSPAVDCESADYQRWKAVLYAVLVFPIALLPLMIALALRLYRHLSWFLPHAGLLTETYHRDRFWFEPVAISRRVLLSGVSVLLWGSPVVRVLALSMCFVAFGLLHLHLRPFPLPGANHLETLSLFSLLLLAILHAVAMISESTVTLVVATSLLVFTLGVLVLEVALGFCGKSLCASQDRALLDEAHESDVDGEVAMQNLGYAMLKSDR